MSIFSADGEDGGRRQYDEADSKKDILLSYPYESMEPFLRLIKEASADPNVMTIKITIYRLARKTRLVEYLCAAAENGKEVTVLIELRARFDEQNNIDWSERLEEAGRRVIYGFEGYKVHSKICLITYAIGMRYSISLRLGREIITRRQRRCIRTSL